MRLRQPGWGVDAVVLLPPSTIRTCRPTDGHKSTASVSAATAGLTAAATLAVLGQPRHPTLTGIARASKTAAISRLASAISASSVNRPKLNRMDPSLDLGGTPRAARTCDGSGRPDVQAAPVEAARRGCRAPRMSRASKPSKPMLALPGCRRSAVGPFTETLQSPVAKRLTNRSRWRATLLRSSSAPAPRRSSAAAPIPVQSGTGTVPERSPPCCPPP